MHETEKNSSRNFYDFFSKQKMADITPQSSWAMRAWAMGLFTVFQIFKLFSRTTLQGLAIFIMSLIITSGITSYLSHHSEKVQILEKQKIDLIKEIDDKRFISILSHIKLIKEKEIEQITKNYWAAVYINEKTNKLRMDVITRETANMVKSTNKFYDFRTEELNKTYQLIKKDKTDLITSTFDGGNPIDKIITWDNITQVKSLSLREDVSNLSDSWMKYLDNPVALADYLETNKALIASKKIF